MLFVERYISCTLCLPNLTWAAVGAAQSIFLYVIAIGMAQRAALDPLRSAGFLPSRRSAKSNFCKTKFYKATVGEPTLTAISGRTLFPKTSHLRGCCAL